MTLSAGIAMDMKEENSIRQALRFEEKIYSEKRNITEMLTVIIIRVNSILVHSNLIGSS